MILIATVRGIGHDESSVRAFMLGYTFTHSLHGASHIRKDWRTTSRDSCLTSARQVGKNSSVIRHVNEDGRKLPWRLDYLYMIRL